ncbi:MAG: hypothetical protein AB2708_03785, partial [Candidatus Thiodiazotropha taylori]
LGSTELQQILTPTNGKIKNIFNTYSFNIIQEIHGMLSLICQHTLSYHISSIIRQIFFLLKQSQKSGSIL